MKRRNSSPASSCKIGDVGQEANPGQMLPESAGCPSTWMEPELGLVSPRSMRMVVVLPVPLGPRKP